MTTNDEQNDDDGPGYKTASSIDPHSLERALCNLTLLGDDPYLRMQAFNLAIVDPFLTNLEYQVLQKLVAEDRTPTPEAAFLSAQSQMWIFAAYELLRTWRQRCRDMIKWADSGGLSQKLEALRKDQGFPHVGKQFRANQVESVINEPARLDAIKRDLRRTHIPFTRIEAIRVSLAKHEVRRKESSVALRPGYCRINHWSGSLDYEIENGQYSLGYISRRDIADEIRALLPNDYVPSDEDISSFDEFMRGPSQPSDA
ncbi:MAG: hypothetical protein KDK08_11920 [Rhizobiaceae bacterium]|nr:hypothetical protein [Rhizobiaceae bacterium]